MDIAVLYDDRRMERWDPLCYELEKQNIKGFTVFAPVYDSKSIVNSINLSHKKIIQHAKDKKLKEICVMEDDVMFPAKDGFEYFIKNKPANYKIYSACNYHDNSYPIPLSLVGFHCYLVHESYYDTFLALPENCHIDQSVPPEDIIVCYPFAALQRAGWSSNNREYANYNTKLKQEDVYGPLYYLPG